MGNDITHEKHLEKLPVNRQRQVPTADSYGKWMVTPKVIDFDLSKTGEAMESKTIARREDKEQMNLLSQLGASSFSDSETEVYKNLSLIEKRIGWDALMKLRDKLFVKDKNNDWDKIGRAHVCTQVTPENLVCRLLLEKKK